MGIILNLSILLATSFSMPPTIDKTVTKLWTGEASQLIESKYWKPDQKLYADFVNARGEKSNEPAFMWGMGVLLSGYAAAIKVDKDKYQPLFNQALDAIEPYWSEARGIHGYSVWPRQDDPDRYYDDNAWVALGLIEAYEATKNPRYLQRSKETHAFVVSCEDDKLGGGLYWHELNRKSKNTCTNGPAIVTALRLYNATKEKAHLDTATRLYTWAKKLQDDDGLYMDNINMEGRIEKMKWTYNTALMLRASCLLYEITKEQKYKDDALKMAAASWQHWYKPEKNALAEAAMFAHHLFEAYFEVSRVTGDPKWKRQALPVLLFVHNQTRTPDGFYGGQWHEAPKPDENKLQLLHQASALRAYAYATTH